MTSRAQQEAEARQGDAGAEASGKTLDIRPDQATFDLEQQSVLKLLGVKHTTQADLRWYMHVCQQTGLNPFMKQIYMIARRSWDADARAKVWTQTIQVGIDGFRVVRQRAERRDGWRAEFEDTIWYDAKGVKEYRVWLLDEPPFACKVVLVKIWPDGTRARFPALLRTDAYADIDNSEEAIAKEPIWWKRLRSQWRVQPDHMIEKCCEAFASRRAAPQDLGGLYLEEEMAEQRPGPQPNRGATVTATVIERDGEPVTPTDAPDASATTGDGATAEPPADDTENRRKGALAKAHAQLGEIGLGGKTKEARAVRLALFAYFARERETDPPMGITSADQLDWLQADRAADAISAFIGNVPGGADPKEALTTLAQSVGRRMARQAANGDE